MNTEHIDKYNGTVVRAPKYIAIIGWILFILFAPVTAFALYFDLVSRFVIFFFLAPSFIGLFTLCKYYMSYIEIHYDKIIKHNFLGNAVEYDSKDIVRVHYDYANHIVKKKVGKSISIEFNNGELLRISKRSKHWNKINAYAILCIMNNTNPKNLYIDNQEISITAKSPFMVCIVGLVLMLTGIFLISHGIDSIIKSAALVIVTILGIFLILNFVNYKAKLENDNLYYKSFIGIKRKYKLSDIMSCTYFFEGNIFIIEFTCYYDKNDNICTQRKFITIPLDSKNGRFLANHIHNNLDLENMFDKNGNISITVKPSVYHIIIGLVSILIGISGFLLHKGDNIESKLNYILFLCTGFLVILEYINFELRLEDDEIYHKNLFGIERWLKLSDMTSCWEHKRIYTLEFNYQYDKSGNRKVSNRKLFLSTDTKEAKKATEYISDYYRHHKIRNK